MELFIELMSAVPLADLEQIVQGARRAVVEEDEAMEGSGQPRLRPMARALTGALFGYFGGYEERRESPRQGAKRENMSLLFQCDGCGTIESAGDHDSRRRGMVEQTVHADRYGNRLLSSWDLCGRCSEQFERWVADLKAEKKGRAQ